MVRNTNWIRFGFLGVVLIGVVAAGCGKQNSNPDNIPAVSTNNAASVPPVNTATGTGTSSTASTVSFDDAANTWGRVEEARMELDTAIKARKLDQVHEAVTKIGGLVKTLPDESAMLPEDKRKTLDAHVRNVSELASMMNKSDGSNDMKSEEEHQTAMNDALDMMKGMYPAGAMHSSMHMPNMDSSSNNKSNNNMSGKGMEDDKMSGMGKPTEPGRQADPSDKPMPGGGMGNDKMSGMGGMGMMDKMMSGMSGTDKSEMKMMMDKMMAMPPAERKKAMQKMSGIGDKMSGRVKKPAPGKQADPNGKPMPGGGMSGDM